MKGISTFWAVLLAGVLWCGLAPGASAQSALPSVVQLPTFRVFTYSGSVVVPDSGGAYLGGNKRSSIGWRRRGLSRGFGFTQANPQASIHAQIIDLDAIDRQLLGGTPEQFLQASRKQESVDSRKPIDPTTEGKALVRLARRQYLDGDKAGSFDTYRMALEVLSGRLHGLAEAEFRRVFGTAAEQSLAVAPRRR